MGHLSWSVIHRLMLHRSSLSRLRRTVHRDWSCSNMMHVHYFVGGSYVKKGKPNRKAKWLMWNHTLGLTECSMTKGQLARSKQSSRDCDSQAPFIRVFWVRSMCAAQQCPVSIYVTSPPFETICSLCTVPPVKFHNGQLTHKMNMTFNPMSSP